MSTLCPTCSRPMTAEEAAATHCCAGATLHWNCADCGRASTGFALPYGRCPHCGGKVVLRDPQRSDDAAALAAVRAAFEIELGGRAFYQRAALESRSPAMRELFERFAVMEGQHMETLARRYHVDLPDPSPVFRLQTAVVFAGLEHEPRDADDLLRIAIAHEKRAAEFFADHAARAQPGSMQRRLFEELAAEEVEHGELLSAELQRQADDRDPARSGLGRRTSAAADAAEAINAAELLLQGHPAGRCAIDGTEPMRYGDLRDRVARAAAAWLERGLQPGHRVAIKLPDSTDWVVAWLGAVWAGGVAVGVNPRVPAPEWQYILEEAGFDIIVAESTDDTPEPWRSRVITLAEGRQAVARARPVEPVRLPPESPAFWVHSSGTSGKPKAVVHSQRCARTISRVSAERLGVQAGDRLYASSRLFFAYPLTNLLLSGLQIGATLILDEQWPSAATVATVAARMRPTVLFSVPSLYRDLLQQGLATALVDAGLRRAVSAGEALPASLRMSWQQATGVPLIDGYGASEVLSLVLTAADGDAALQVSPGVAVTPLDAAAAAAGGPTRLLFRTETMALGYLDRPAAQAETFRDGAFCPADLFVRAADGGWAFAGREDSLVKIRGRWVNLIELEERIGQGVAGLREGAAVCVHDSDGIESVAYFFACPEGERSEVARALERRVAELPRHQRPTWLRPVPALPRTATGKLVRRRLQEMHEWAG